MFDVKKIVRRNIQELVPYSSARAEFNGTASVWLDANENCFGSPVGKDLNRYPDPLQVKLKASIANWKETAPNNIFLGNGSDEAIDLLFRIFCEPGKDNVIICPPTYGMYEVSANINDIAVRIAPLTPSFQLDIPVMWNCIDPNTRLIFICSPNNPAGNNMNRGAILTMCRNFDGIVVVDEAYIDFSEQASLLDELDSTPNLVILQTFSKAMGMAGIRLGMAFASVEIISLFNKVKAPYNVSEITQRCALEVLGKKSEIDISIKQILTERERLERELKSCGIVKRIYPSSANFLLVKVEDAEKVYEELKKKGVIVRDRSNVRLCEGCLRITVGTEGENELLIKIFKELRIAKNEPLKKT